ncbi:MAG: hypothetical protein A3K19_25410 [Lentisphaerae bacterium RIFOXYB12_FULL_65_16]|nr:MAG: hypothetical protein A3K18_22065 [Lentisphaerae bacterium RIFOXYA12_64_32]OGV87652.1 MAG: hypothetical protein A3K19_25410 [Lentisphaerae bacterium RIFOXYB12_FULL_65_16]
MRRVRLLPVGGAALDLLDRLSGAIEDEIGVTCRVDGVADLDPGFALHPGRRQFHSSRIVERLVPGPSDHVLGITPVDLYIPILTFVFGEAETGGRRGLVSYCRLRQDFYGLLPDAALLEERLLKEALHEIGHMMSLHHCDDYHCVMASSHAVEWIDVKSVTFCDRCKALRKRAEAITPGASSAR